jgi:hypothetical protein
MKKKSSADRTRAYRQRLKDKGLYEDYLMKQRKFERESRLRRLERINNLKNEKLKKAIIEQDRRKKCEAARMTRVNNKLKPAEECCLCFRKRKGTVKLSKSIAERFFDVTQTNLTASTTSGNQVCPRCNDNLKKFCNFKKELIDNQVMFTQQNPLTDPLLAEHSIKSEPQQHDEIVIKQELTSEFMDSEDYQFDPDSDSNEIIKELLEPVMTKSKVPTRKKRKSRAKSKKKKPTKLSKKPAATEHMPDVSYNKYPRKKIMEEQVSECNMRDDSEDMISSQCSFIASTQEDIDQHESRPIKPET